MFEKFIDWMIENRFFRIVMTSMGVGFPIMLVTCWLGAAYLNAWLEEPFIPTMLGLFFFGVIGSYPVGLPLYYASERWIIRDRARESLGWLAVRILNTVVISILGGFGALFAIRAGMQVYPPLVEMFYFVFAIIVNALSAIVYTLLEHSIQEIKRRESRLKMKIAEMQIQINELKRQEEVEEISSSDFFQELQQKAAQLRGTPPKPAEE